VNSARQAQLLSIAERCGTPSYVYFADEIRANVDRLRSAFAGQFLISYAVKANPAPGVLGALHKFADLLDVSSAGEIKRAVEAGWEGSAISFTGPGKREDELQHAVDARIGEVVVESVEEARALARLARRAGIVQRIMLRLAPSRVPAGFGDTMGGKPVAFGVDEEDLETVVPEILGLRGLSLIGFHCYSGTQCLQARAVVENWAIHAQLFRSTAQLAGIQPERLVFGSGLGIPYHDGQQPLDLAQIAEAAGSLLAELRQALPRTRLVLETGRFLVGEPGVFLTRVMRVKDSRGTRIGICDGGLNYHLAACGLFGMALRRNYRMVNLTATDGPGRGRFQLSGPLCTSIDVLGRNVELPRLEAGDVIALEASGAYGASASPTHFISHPPVREWLVSGDRVADAAAVNGAPGRSMSAGR
jgi:diaminopimelate decarboxylase